MPRTAGAGAWYLVGSVPALALHKGIPPMEEIRLFRVPTGYQASLRLEVNGWWTLVVDQFFEGEPWSESDRCVYERLSLAEAADCLLQEIFTVRSGG